ncbi:DegT/DnrJ/EryC1/StrS family aminotransferase [Thermodesulfobacteriota bacterium]
MNWKIPLSDIDFGPEEEEAVLRVLRSKWLTMGSETEAFEKEFAEHIGVRHAIAVSNGTAALHLSMLALDIGPGDAVIQPAVNFVAAANMTTAVGATPVFTDIISMEEPTISPDSIRDRLNALSSSDAAKPKAIVVMHYGGYPCRMDEIKTICDEHNLVLIEDACHGIGGAYNQKKLSKNGNQTNDKDTFPLLGSIGDAGCFSFFSNKNLATGEGGMVATNQDDIADKIRLLRSHGMTTLTWERYRGHAATYDVSCHGYNYRSDEIRSAIGCEQLKKLENNNDRRRELTSLYWKYLEPIIDKGWALPFRSEFSSALNSDSQLPKNHASGIPSCHLLPIVAPDPGVRWQCAEQLKKSGIQTSLHYPLIPGFSAFERNSHYSKIDMASDFCNRVITLPLYPTMRESDVSFVAEQLITAA